MNTLEVTATYGELNTTMFNQLTLNDMGGEAALTMDSMGDGVAFPLEIVVNFPKIKPRITVAAETRTAKVRA